MRARVVLLAILLMGFGSVSLSADETDSYTLLPGPATTLEVDQPLTLGLARIDVDGSIHDIDLKEQVSWSINGGAPDADPSEGKLTLSLTLSQAKYTAPHTVPKVNPVAVAISVLPQGQIKSKLTFICTITIVDRENVFSITGPRVPISIYQLDDRYSMPQVRAMLARATMQGPELGITVSAMQPGGAGGGEMYHANATMMLFINGSAPGEYPWKIPVSGSSNATTVMLTIAGGQGADMYSTGDCLPHGDNNCKAQSTKGVTRILSFDTKSNEVSGEFRGQVVKLVNGKPSSYVQTSGSFKATLQAIVPGMKR